MLETVPDRLPAESQPLLEQVDQCEHARPAIEADDVHVDAQRALERRRREQVGHQLLDIDAALDHLDRALRLDPDLETARLLRAAAREMAGDFAAARADAKAALTDNPDCAPAARLLERLPEH